MKKIFITIYLILLLSLFFVAYGLFPMTNELFETQTLAYTRQIAKGTFSLVSDRLVYLDDAGRQQALSELQTRFGYPLGLVPMASFPVDPEDREGLMNGLIMDEDDEGYILFQRLGRTDMVLTMGGPFPGSTFFFYGRLFLWGGCILFMVFPALAWTLILNRDMKRIEQAGSRFVAGNLDARVQVPRFSSLAQIASVFNTMAERSKQLLASQKDLTNSVSHEIRTPLSRIQFSLEMVAAWDRLPDREKKYIARIGRDADEIEALVDEMLTYARFEGRQDLGARLQKNDLVSWLGAVAAAERPAGQIDLEFRNRMETCAVVTRFDPVHLGRAFQNLIRNGTRYAASRVRVTLSPGRSGVLVHIDDDGPGIPDEHRCKIFDPFYRMDDSRNRDSGGYGLGLAIVKQIVVWHGGAVSVNDSPLGGARFTVRLNLT